MFGSKPRYLLADEPFAGLDRSQYTTCLTPWDVWQRRAGILLTDHNVKHTFGAMRYSLHSRGRKTPVKKGPPVRFRKIKKSRLATLEKAFSFKERIKRFCLDANDCSLGNVMALDLRLDIKMSQQLVMTPQLQQAIKMLQRPAWISSRPSEKS